jgi:hypothetical protein
MPTNRRFTFFDAPARSPLDDQDDLRKGEVISNEVKRDPGTSRAHGQSSTKRLVATYPSGNYSLEGSVRVRASKYSLRGAQPLRGYAAARMASTVTLRRRKCTLRRMAETSWL